ncbi:hypothetical protein [Flavobacterium flavigenum]|uniref:hypothetical protein n=1 Tax=Flavobacterium flavigenum TaxID=3003258 RepID=UPI0022AC609F|nr:hypothetical protein [Flavobacterium flavigenum]
MDIKIPLNIDLQNVNLLITFSNLKFQGKQIHFYKIKKECLHRFQFEKCTFESDIFIESDFEDITFISNTFNCNKFHIQKSTIGVLEFFNDEYNNQTVTSNIFKKGNLKIADCDFDTVFWLKNVEFIKNTSVDINNNKFLEGCYFDSISLDQIIFYDCNFSKEFRYDASYNRSQFRECSFSGLTTFSDLQNVNSSFLWFENCHFYKFTNFNNYWLHKLRIEETTFSDNVSFQQTYFDIVCFIRIIFEKKVWFDDIQIKKIDDCDKITIRTIKQELQKAENRIDFNRFRAYELAAHYKELDWKWNSGFIDKSILFVTKISTDFGNSWRRALVFTLISGFSIYLLLYIFENRDYQIAILNCDNWARLFSGFFRFLLVTDFYNPLEADRVYLTNPFSWLIFIFGKIVIAFGIYEMIQSFRKFKA